MNKIKTKSYSSNQVSKDLFNPIKEKKLISNHYSNTNLDNDNSEISTMSLKANKVINEFKKTLKAAEKIENDLNKSKYSLRAITEEQPTIKERKIYDKFMIKLI